MPELPEVESVRLGLAAHLPGATLTHAAVLHPRSVRRHLAGPDDFAAALLGRTFGTPRRRGKYLWLPLADGDAVLAHLGMSGQFRIEDPSAPLHPHTRVVLVLDTGVEVRFVDQRMFGGLAMSYGGAEAPGEIAHIALDLLDPALDLGQLSRRIRAKSSAIKRVLLDQTVVSGIGNIYADEALWRARVHHGQPAGTLSAVTANRLLRHARAVMTEALEAGGTSFDALYVNVNGESGYFDRRLDAYGQEGRPCRRCGTPIVREHFMNRSSSFCPRCQQKPRS